MYYNVVYLLLMQCNIMKRKLILNELTIIYIYIYYMNILYIIIKIQKIFDIEYIIYKL